MSRREELSDEICSYFRPDVDYRAFDALSELMMLPPPAPAGADTSDETAFRCFAAGCISGHVADWPQLIPAMRWAEREIDSLRAKSTPAGKVTRIDFTFPADSLQDPRPPVPESTFIPMGEP